MHNLLQEYKNTKFNHNNFVNPSEKILISFRRSPKVEITGRGADEKYEIKFSDRRTGNILCSNTISKNCWLSPIQRYYVDWNIQIFKNGVQIVDHNLDLKGEKVLIVFDSKSVGDTISWVPQVEEFRKIHKCELYVSTFHNQLFRNSYPDITFIEPNSPTDVKIKYEWWIGVYLDDVTPNHPIHWQKLPLYKIASDQLGIRDHKEIKCKIDSPPKINLLNNQKYVCISISSTAGCKHWQYKGGWQTVVDYLNSIGYKVVLVQRERLPWMDLPELKNVIHPEINSSLDAASIINDCEFMIGLSSGMSWLAWALNKKVILISGFTSEFHEFSTPHRIINKDVCNSCWHDTDHKFDRANWNWCPRDKNFECSTSITPDKVIKEVDKLV